MADSSLSWVCPLTLISSLSCIYASLQHLFIRWTDQDHNPSDDEQFSGGISSRVEQFYIDDGWVFILSWVITNPLYLISATTVLLLSWVCPLLLYFIILLHVPMLRLQGGVEMMVIFTCGHLWLSTLINCITRLWLKSRPSQHYFTLL
jgi:hypothetical protein